MAHLWDIMNHLFHTLPLVDYKNKAKSDKFFTILKDCKRMFIHLIIQV